MKKIIKSSVLFIGACFFASAINAQLSSDKPALTAQQMADLIQKGKTNTAKSTTTNATVSVTSDKPAMTSQQNEQMMKRGSNEVKVEPATSVSTAIPGIPSQGEVKAEPVSQTKVQTSPAQTQKPVPAKQQ